MKVSQIAFDPRGVLFALGQDGKIYFCLPADGGWKQFEGPKSDAPAFTWKH